MDSKDMELPGMVYRFHDYTLDPASREMRHGTHRIALEPKVFQVLLYLLEHRDRMVSKAELLTQCWPETFVSESALTRCLTRLRKAVQPIPTAPPVIATRHRQGYRFVAEVTVLTQPLPPTLVETAQPSVQPTLQAATPTVPSGSLEAPTRSASLGAERRQLTVLFCDVVDSTILAGQLDPEDYRDVMVRYQATCTTVIEHYGGHVAQYLGDGLLVYFGWPQAHEDDARRAVYAGLALVTAVQALRNELSQAYGMCLALRIGIHTGLVVVGAGEGGAPYGQLAMGATPNLAAKIQSLAAPDTVVISAATSHLVQGYFVCEFLGDHSLPGATEPNALYQVLHVSGARGRLDIASPQHLTPFVGREAELAVLRERVGQVRQGMGQVMLLSGEAGIGKSRLVQEVITTLVADGFTCVECRCSSYYQHTALHPISEWLQRSLRCGSDTPVTERLARLEALVRQARLDGQESLPLLASLLHLDLPEGRYPVLQLTPHQQRQRTLETLLALVLGLADRQPVLLIVEDVHWIDPTTLEWLGLVIDQGPTAPLYTLLTCRPTFASPWGSRTHVTLLSVPRLTSPQVAQMVQWLGGDQLPAAQVQHIVRHTDGVPLFVEEVAKFVLTAQRLQSCLGDVASAHAGPEVPIPATLRDSLMARLDQLGPAKGTAQLGATIGREFSYALLQAVTHLDEDLVRQDLKQLVEAELLYQRGVSATAIYQFKHALIQEAAYASLLRKTRQQYHQHIAQALEAQFPDTVATQPELLAHHYTEASLSAHAIPYWQRAGQQAIERSALPEVIGHLTQGLALVESLPDTHARAQHELSLLTTLGPTLIATKGHSVPEVERVYTRARVLCEQVGDDQQLFLVLNGLRRVYYARADLPRAQECGEQLLAVATRQQNPAQLIEAHLALAQLLVVRGELACAYTHYEQCLALYNPDRHRAMPSLYPRDTAVTIYNNSAWLLSMLGYLDQAVDRASAACTLARDLAHPFSEAIALLNAAEVSLLCGAVQTAQVQTEAALALCAEHQFALQAARGSVLLGVALATQGYCQEGSRRMQEGLAAIRALRAEFWLPGLLALVIEAHRKSGNLKDAQALVAEALILIDTTAMRSWAAELYRLKGEFLLAQALPNMQEAGTYFQQALDLARQQQAKLLELRAAMSLSRLWHQQGQWAQARQLLAEVYDWFTEGFDTADLQEAKRLLAELS
jgi:class 3 adenylate cyclase/predicted ATPase